MYSSLGQSDSINHVQIKDLETFIFFYLPLFPSTADHIQANEDLAVYLFFSFFPKLLASLTTTTTTNPSIDPAYVGFG